MRNLLKMLSVVTLFVCTHAMANDAGCGLGNVVIQKNTKISQLFAMTTNHTFSSQILGITFGTSGCSSSSWTKIETEAIKYAEMNFQSLKVDAARGNGESLSALADIMGCNSRFSALSQSHYPTLFPTETTTPAEMVENLSSQIKTSTEWKQVCGHS